ncbi:MAG: cell division protein FtsZ [Candidatus Accumulibacter sp.]|jgi:cell division protein FtsZ|nr:cell division protein FtsZ [Accumulibacter sp.]
MFKIINEREKPKTDTIVKVIGVGDAGGNTINHLIQEGVPGVEFIAINTDAESIKRSMAHRKLLLGKMETGANARPEVGRDAALGKREEIAKALMGAHMVFIVVGMGGGTGTGAAPVIARIAREMGMPTIAVATKPFAWEDERTEIAEIGIVELQKHVDSLIVVSCDRLDVVFGGDATMKEVFDAVDNMLGDIVAIIANHGLVTVDLNDVRAVMGKTGRATMGSATAYGQNRARAAAERAVVSPLLEDAGLSSAKGVLVNITASHNLKMNEVNEVMSAICEFTADDAHIIFSVVCDENMGEQLRVTVVTTGLA